MGGEIYQSTLTFLDSKEGKYYAKQSGVVRSSLLFDTKFEAAETHQVTPMVVRKSDKQGAKNYSRAAGVLSGDFLKNRSWQGIGIQYLEPTRSEVQVDPLDAERYEVYSSVSAQFEELLYIDSKGDYWIVDGLGQGGRKPLRSIERHQGNDFWLTIEENTNNNHYNQLRRWSKHARDAFVGITREVQELPAIVLPAIRIQEMFTVVCGTLETSEVSQ